MATESNKSITKVLKLIDVIAQNPEPMRLMDIASKADLPESTTLRLLMPLEEAGYVYRNPDGKLYSLSMKFAFLGNRAREHNTHKLASATAILKKLSTETGEDVYLGIEQDSSITYTNSVRGKWSKENGVNYRAENWSPMYCTAIGKLILAQHELGALESFLRFTPLIAYTKNTITRQEELMAELEDIRSKGYALDMEESNDGISSIAAPIYNYANRMIAGIAVIAPSSRLTQERIKVLLPKLLDAAGVISKNMGFRGEMAGLIF